MKQISDLWFLPVPLPGAISSPALCAPIPLWAVHPLRPVFFPHPTKSPSPGRSQGPLEVGLPAQCPPHPCQIPELQELKIKILQPLLLLAGTQADFAPVTEKQRPRREQDWHSRQPPSLRGSSQTWGTSQTRVHCRQWSSPLPLTRIAPLATFPPLDFRPEQNGRSPDKMQDAILMNKHRPQMQAILFLCKIIKVIVKINK